MLCSHFPLDADISHNYAMRMRTTLMISDELYVEVKRLAAGRRTTVSRVVNDALRRELGGSVERNRPARVSIPVFGDLRSGVLDSTPEELDVLAHEDSPA